MKSLQFFLDRVYMDENVLKMKLKLCWILNPM